MQKPAPPEPASSDQGRGSESKHEYVPSSTYGNLPLTFGVGAVGTSTYQLTSGA